MVICLEQGADLHMAQRIPLPLTVSCFSIMQIGFTFLVPFWYWLTWVVPDKGPLNGCVLCCAMQEAENDIALVTQDYMYSAAFQGTPLAKSVLGTTESLRYPADCLVFVC